MNAHARYPRRLALIASTAVAAAVLLLPSLVLRPSQQSAALLVAQVLISGILLGLGRQGIDLLLLRTVLVSVAAPAGWLLGDPHGMVCSGFSDCYRGFVVGLIAFGLGGSVVLTLVSLPTTLVWSKGAGALKPEISWRMPRTGRQWVFVAGAVVVVLGAIYLSLGVPAY